MSESVVEHYRGRAMRLRERAAETPSTYLREQFERCAQVWDQMADDLERGGPATPAPPPSGVR
jgi:hypothetical protein